MAWHGKAGFYDGASARIVDMLRFRDVSQPDDPENRSGRSTSSQFLMVLLAIGSSTALLAMIETLMPTMI
jgi:hypothetical protein